MMMSTRKIDGTRHERCMSTWRVVKCLLIRLVMLIECALLLSTLIRIRGDYLFLLMIIPMFIVIFDAVYVALYRRGVEHAWFSLSIYVFTAIFVIGFPFIAVMKPDHFAYDECFDLRLDRFHNGSEDHHGPEATNETPAGFFENEAIQGDRSRRRFRDEAVEEESTTPAGSEPSDSGNESEEGILMDDKKKLVVCDSSEVIVVVFVTSLVILRSVMSYDKNKFKHDAKYLIYEDCINTGSDMVEFISNIHEHGIFGNSSLFTAIVVIFGLSTFQFSFIYGSKLKNPLTKIALNRKPFLQRTFIFLFYATFATEIWYILLGLFLQDLPFLIIRLIVFNSYVLHKNYLIYFFIVKNIVFCIYRVYRTIELLVLEKRLINGGK